MTINTIQKRIAKLNQQKEYIESKLKTGKAQLEKASTRNKIELGGLVIKAKLNKLKSNELYGALLHIANELDVNPNIVEKFKALGADAFQKENINKTPITLKFPTQPGVEVRKIIRESGLRWNKLRAEWEGYAELDKLQNVIKNIDHTLTKVNTEK